MLQNFTIYIWQIGAKKSSCARTQTSHKTPNSHIKLQKDTLQVERNPKRQLKDFLLDAYVLFMCMSGDSGSGKWLFISFIPLHLKMSSFVWIQGSLGALIEGCGDAVWSEVHTALLIPLFLTNKRCFYLSCPYLYLLCLLIYFCLTSSISRRYARPVEVASPSRKDQRQPL